MEKLEKTIDPESDSYLGLRSIDGILGTSPIEGREKIVKMGIVKYAYSDDDFYANNFSKKNHEIYIAKVVSNIVVGGKREKATREIAKAVEQYYEVTGEVYNDLHTDNVMIAKDGTYKLIDL